MKRILRSKLAWLSAILLVAGVLLTFHPSRPLYTKQRSLDITAPDGTVLRGTLSLPRWRSTPLATMVMVHGSGPLTRMHLIGDTRRLVRRGFAVLAYDKRGVGESGGELPRAWAAEAVTTLGVLAGDAAAAFELARKQPDVDPTRVGFFGGSQASWIITIANDRLETPPRFNVILSGAAVCTGLEQFYSDLTGDGHRTPAVTDAAEVQRLVERFDGARGFDPEPLLARSRVATLWMLGDRDLSVPTFASVRVLSSLPPEIAALHTVKRYPQADHSLYDVQTGEPVAFWDDLLEWLKAIGVTKA